MKHFPDTSSHLLILKRGEELIKTLDTFAAKNNLNGGWVNVIGGASSVTLGYYNPETREYQWRTFDEPLEIIGLQGNLAYVDGEPFWHIHGTFSRADYSVIGGHVKECTIGLTGEVCLTPHATKLTRIFDDETGLKLIDKL